MEEFGDWIYILIIIAAGVFSLIGSTRKKARQMAEANQQQQPRKVSSTSGDEGDFWDDFIPQAEKKPVIISQKKKETAPSNPSSGKQVKPFLNRFLEGHPSLTIEAVEEPSPISASEEEYAAITLEDIPKEANEWRTVFIYNEIFSRKN